MTTIQVTQGRNGYTQGIYDAQIFESVEELQNSGKYLFKVYRQRDGWDLWEFAGAEFGAFDMEERLNIHKSDDEELLLVKSGWCYGHILHAVIDMFGVEEDHIPEWEIKLAEDINKAHIEGMDEVYVVEYLYDEFKKVYPAEAVQYHFDVWTYAIGYEVKQ